MAPAALFGGAAAAAGGTSGDGGGGAGPLADVGQYLLVVEVRKNSQPAPAGGSGRGTGGQRMVRVRRGALFYGIPGGASHLADVLHEARKRIPVGSTCTAS